MAEALFCWLISVASAAAMIFAYLMIQDLWRQRSGRRKTNVKPLGISRRSRRAWHPIVRGYDYPELLLEDMEMRSESNDKATETKTHA
jgi:hypothetical protein